MKILALITISILLISPTIYGQLPQDEYIKLDDLANTVVLLSQKINDNINETETGSGNIIFHNNKYFLLTARHVAVGMKDDANIIFRELGDVAKVVRLINLTKNHNLDWVHHCLADISLIELEPNSTWDKNRLSHFSFPSLLILNNEINIPMGTDVCFFGFPNVDYDMTHFSPLSITSSIASGTMTYKMYMANTDIFYLDKPSTQGCSGSGVFINVKKGDMPLFATVIGMTRMAGIVSGNIGDNTGGKHAIIVPTYYVWELLNTF